MWYSNYNLKNENPIVVQYKSINQELPTDLFEYILSFLDPKDMQSAAAVDQFWSLRTVTVACKEFIWIQNGNQLLIEKLTSDDVLVNMYSAQIGRLSYLADNKCPLKPKNLINVRLSLLFLRDTNVDALKGISLTDLQNLKEGFCTHKLSSFFKTTFILARIYEKINQMNIYGGGTPDLQNEFREFIKKDILEIDDFNSNEILMIPEAIHDDQLYNMIAVDIAQILKDKGYAVNITAELSSTTDDASLCDTSQLLTSAGYTDIAESLTERIEDNVLKRESFHDILKNQINQLTFHGASLPTEVKPDFDNLRISKF